MANGIFWSIIITGFSGIVAQIILLRELFVVFQGNELSIGVILANWLILEAIGSFWVGKRIESVKNKLSIFIVAMLALSVFLPVSIYLARILKTLIGVGAGEGVGIVSMLWSSFIVMFPVSIIHGTLFTFCCRLYDETRLNPSKSIAKTYIYETLGTAVGGVVFGYFFVQYFNSFYIAFFVVLINLLCCIYFSFIAKNRFLVSLNISIFFVVMYLILTGNAERLHRLSINKQWRNQNVVYSKNSVYGNITVIQNDEQFTFISNGTPIVTTPTPDIIYTEESTHFAMLAHPHPRKVLILGGGAGGRIFELLKYKNLEKIDYAELDPLLLETLKKFPTPLTHKELSSDIVKIHYVDGRLFGKSTEEKYDVIFIGVSEAPDLLANRFHTAEFYETLKHKLSDDGIISINFPGSMVYLSDDIAKLNGSIVNTLNAVFPAVKIIPGDFNIFLCSKDKEILNLTPEIMYRRLIARKVESSFLTLSYMNYRLDEKWLSWFLDSLKKVESDLNYDFKPMAMFYNLTYWSAKFSPSMHKIFLISEKIKLWMFALFFLILTAAGILFVKIFSVSSVARSFNNFVIPYAIGTTGFAGMIFDLALIFGFQVLYGYAYHQIGLLISFFMVGAIVGSGLMAKFLPKIKNQTAFFIKVESLIILFAALLVPIIIFMEANIETVTVLPFLFLILSFISGFLVGTEFPLGINIYLLFGKDMSFTSGLLYASDLAGGFLGGILGSVVMLPVLGFFQTMIVLIMLKLTSIIFLVVQQSSSPVDL